MERSGQPTHFPIQALIPNLAQFIDQGHSADIIPAFNALTEFCRLMPELFGYFRLETTVDLFVIVHTIHPISAYWIRSKIFSIFSLRTAAVKGFTTYPFTPAWAAATI